MPLKTLYFTALLAALLAPAAPLAPGPEEQRVLEVELRSSWSAERPERPLELSDAAPDTLPPGVLGSLRNYVSAIADEDEQLLGQVTTPAVVLAMNELTERDTRIFRALWRDFFVDGTPLLIGWLRRPEEVLLFVDAIAASDGDGETQARWSQVFRLMAPDTDAPRWRVATEPRSAAAQQLFDLLASAPVAAVQATSPALPAVLPAPPAGLVQTVPDVPSLSAVADEGSIRLEGLPSPGLVCRTTREPRAGATRTARVQSIPYNVELHSQELDPSVVAAAEPGEGPLAVAAAAALRAAGARQQDGQRVFFVAELRTKSELFLVFAFGEPGAAATAFSVVPVQQTGTTWTIPDSTHGAFYWAWNGADRVVLDCELAAEAPPFENSRETER